LVLRFIQDMQRAIGVTIKNGGLGLIVDEAFSKHAIYSIKDLYSDYDQF